MLQAPPRPYTVEQTAEFFGCSKGLIYKAIKDKTLPSVRIGAKYYIPARAIEALAEAREAQK